MPLSVDESKRISLWGRCLRCSAAPRASHSCALVMRSPFRSILFPGLQDKGTERVSRVEIVHLGILRHHHVIGCEA
jgi:hypothetical protein